MEHFICNSIEIAGDRANLKSTANHDRMIMDMEDGYYISQFVTLFPENHGLKIIDVSSDDPDWLTREVHATVSVENYNHWTPEMINFWSNTSTKVAKPFMMPKEDLLSRSV
jgi:hypothetical protein